MNRFTKMVVASLGLALVAGPGVAADVVIPDGATLAASLAGQFKVSKNGVYIVRLAENPVAAYEGDIKGYRATRPKNNSKLNPKSKAVISYADYLTDRHDEVLAKVGGGKKLYSYKYSYNGFAAKLNGNQVRELRKMPGVVSVSPDELMQMDTVTTPMMLNLDDIDNGVWTKLGGVDNAGEGVIVGIVDSGIWPESESFSDRTRSNKKGKDGKLGFQQIPGWHGKCTPGEAFVASDCNQKLIGAQWFNAGFGGDAGVKAVLDYEFASARDTAGHGTHTSSTAAGNAAVSVVIDGFDFGVASGMAPHARIATYKVCWGRGNDGGCFSSDSVAAIDQAVIDGVDVLNFSISGSQTSFLTDVEVAFLFAADAGVFVAASAGNSGPRASTVAHNSPWLMTVAAGTHDRVYKATVTVGEDPNKESYNGVSIDLNGVGPNDLVYSLDVYAGGAPAGEESLCYPNTLDPAKAKGKIVLCDRGKIARVDKSLAVMQAGGIGMILANAKEGDSLNADFHSVPTVHVAKTEGDKLRGLAQDGGNQAELSEGEAGAGEASQVAGFSSRGPALAGNGDLLKPDIMAPGVDVIAAVSPPGNGGEDFASYQGTSMSSPHMAGLGALMKQAHPDWSPAAIKSAFMTTATQKTNLGNLMDGNPFGYGAGFVQPNAAIDPGLVYDAGWNDWLAFLFGPTDPSNLNYPSIAIGSLVGTQTVTRTVTNVGSKPATYEVSYDGGLVGVTVGITPNELTLNPGQSKSYAVSFSTTAAAVNGSYTFGNITWANGEHSVRSVLAVKPVELAAPAEIHALGVSGTEVFDVSFGYEGVYGININGLMLAETQDGSVVDDPANDINAALANGDYTLHLVFPAPGAALQRIALFDDYTDGNDDIDLYVFDDVFVQVGGSGSGTSAEQVDIINPTSTVYYVVVHGWQTDGPDANYTLFSWSPSVNVGNMTVDAPNTAMLGGTDEITVNWSELDTGDRKKYLGVLSHNNGSDEIGQTVINIEND